MAWRVSGDADLPLADREREWDSAAAEKRLFHRAGWDDNPNPEKAREGFFVHDDAAPENKTAYKLPFADVIDGRLMAVPRGIFSAAQVLEGARGGVDLPKDVIARVRRRVGTYYHKMGEEPPWQETEQAHASSAR